MEIRYLGTGGAEGFPSIFCQCEACRKVRTLLGKNVKTRSCTLIDQVMIDLSPDIFSQCINSHVDLSEVNHLVFTHSHSDHLNTTEICFRLREMASVIQKKDKKVMEIYGNDAVRDGIMEVIAKDPHVDLTRMRFHRIQKFEPFRIGHLKFTPLKAYHKLDEEALIFVIEDGRSTLLYANDTHMGIRENVELREKLRRMHAVTPDTEYYLNHYSHMCGMIPQEYERLVGQEGFLLTYDGLSVTV